MKIIFIASLIFLYSSGLAQSKITITIKDQKCDILGYTMDPDASGNKQSISLFGSMQNALAIFNESYLTASPINSITVLITDASAGDTKIELSDVTVYGIKEYLSSYANGMFNLSASGNANTELKCTFKKIMTYVGGTAGKPFTEKNNLEQFSINTTSEQSWEIKMDSSVTGIGGAMSMQLPKGLSYSTHIKIFEAGVTKKIAASWFGNNETKLLPGLYDVVVDDDYTIKNVPVEAGKKTRLKMGVFKITSYGTMEIESSDQLKFSRGGPFSMLLPQGTYYLNGNKKSPVVIKDGEVTKL
jgi:hypothetical protein